MQYCISSDITFNSVLIVLVQCTDSLKNQIIAEISWKAKPKNKRPTKNHTRLIFFAFSSRLLGPKAILRDLIFCADSKRLSMRISRIGESEVRMIRDRQALALQLVRDRQALALQLVFQLPQSYVLACSPNVQIVGFC